MESHRANGLHDITGSADDDGAFRTPTLRNVAIRAPYMHDGSLATNGDVILRLYAVKGHAARTLMARTRAQFQ